MSLHFQCFALLPQALTQSPQQGRPAADHMARLPDQVMTWSHNMYSLSPSSLRQCPPRFTRHVLQRYLPHNCKLTHRSSTTSHSGLQEPPEGICFGFYACFLFFVKRWFRNRSVFNHILSGRYNASSIGAGSLCTSRYNDHQIPQASQWLQPHNRW